MKLITRDTDYAIRALCFIAKRKGEIVTAKELVDCLKIPRPFLRKLLQVLNKKGLLRSYKGIGGGFKLNRSPDSITLDRLITIFQGLLKFCDHKFKKRICPEVKNCPLKKRLDTIEEYVKSQLKSITIALLISR